MDGRKIVVHDSKEIRRGIPIRRARDRDFRTLQRESRGLTIDGAAHFHKLY